MKTRIAVIIVLLLFAGLIWLSFYEDNTTSINSSVSTYQLEHNRLICTGGLSYGDSIIKNKLREKLCK